jgi:hypothetical protein
MLLLYNLSSEPGEAQAPLASWSGTACPTSPILEQYYLGELAPAQESAIAAHLAADCLHCQVTVAALMQHFADLGAAAMGTDLAPAAENRTGVPAFPTFWAKLKEQATALGQQLVERVTFMLDLVTAPAPTLALRGDGNALPLIYRSGDIEVRIDLQPELGTDRKVLVGQVKAPNLDLSAAEVQLRQAEATIAGTTLAGNRGRFQLPSLPPGDYALVVRSAQWEIQIPNLHFG